MRAITVSRYGAASEPTAIPRTAPRTTRSSDQGSGRRHQADGSPDGRPRAGIENASTDSLVLGADLHGVVEALGEGASRFSAGEKTTLILGAAAGVGSFATQPAARPAHTSSVSVADIVHQTHAHVHIRT